MFGVTAYSEAAFSTENSNVIAYPQGIALTGLMGEESNVANADVNVTGNQSSFISGGAVAGASALITLTGSQLTTSIGEETVNISVDITGIELSLTNKTFSQDTLTTFAQAPFATLSQSVVEIPSVVVEGTTGAGQLPSFSLAYTLGPYSVSADGNVGVVVTEHTINTSIADVSITGHAEVSVTGIATTLSIGDESAFTNHTVEVTGQQLLNISIGEESVTGNVDMLLTGIQLTNSIGDVDQETKYAVTGSQMATSIGSVTTIGTAEIDITGIQLQYEVPTPNIIAWAEVDTGISSVWTEVDRAA